MPRRGLLTLGAFVLLAACSSSGTTTAPTTRPPSSTGAATTPAGPTMPATTVPGAPTTVPSGPLAVALDLATGAERWRRPAGGLGLQGQVAGDALVVRSCDTNDVKAVDLATGDPRWTVPLPCDASTGVRVDGDTVVAQTTGAVVGLALADGSSRWRTDLASPLGQGTVVGSGGTVVVQSGPSAIVALDAATGTQRWQVDGPGGLATLVANDEVVVASNTAAVMALDPATGAVRWQRPLTGPVGPGLALAGPLVILDQLTIGGGAPSTAQPTTAGGPSLEIVALDATSGAERWRHAAGSTTAFPAGHTVFDDASGTIAVGWSGANGTRGSLLEGLGSDGKQRWSVPGLVPIASSDGAIVAASSPDDPGAAAQSTVAAFDAASGKQHWQASPPTGFVGGGVAGSGVVVVGGAGNDSGVGSPDQASQVRGLGAADGTQRWQTDAGGVASLLPPAIAGGVAAVVVCPPDGSSEVVAFDLTSGTKRWEHAGPSCGAGGSLPVVSAGTGLLVAATDGGVVGLDAADGHERWTAALGDVPQGLAGDATGLVADEGGRLVGLDPATGKQRWQLDGGDGGLTPAAGSGVTVNAVPDASGVTFVVTTYDLVTGAPRWQVSLPGTEVQVAVSQPLVVLAVTGQSAVDASTPAVELVAFDARTGTQRWRHDDPGAALGMPVVADPSTGQVVTTIVPSSADLPHTLALGPTGQMLWKADGLVATAMGTGLVLAVPADGSALVALDAATGKERWRSKAPATVGAVGVGGDAVVSLLTTGGSD